MDTVYHESGLKDEKKVYGRESLVNAVNGTFGDGLSAASALESISAGPRKIPAVVRIDNNSSRLNADSRANSNASAASSHLDNQSEISYQGSKSPNFYLHTSFDQASHKKSVLSPTPSSPAFSKDYLPTRFDRFSQGDLPLKTIIVIEIVIDVLLTVVFIQFNVNMLTNYNLYHIVQFIIFVVFWVLILFWLNYKLHNILLAAYRLVVDLNVVKRNDKYYSGVEIPDIYMQDNEYPHVTIQVPVYKENLENTIKPTLLNCVREARRYMMETGAYCNIIVCDDGYNVVTDEERAARMSFYEEYKIAFTARPHPSKLPRRGRFKKAGNLNFSMNYSDPYLNPQNNETSKRVEELLTMGALFHGDIQYGSYVLLIDSDTRLPVAEPSDNGCIKKLAKEMTFDGEDVLYLQCFTGPYMSVKSSAEKAVFHHTCSIYNSILINTAMHGMAPLVGHNVLLSTDALTRCAELDPDNKNYKLYWAEDRISEDFDAMMRGCDKGYIGRYVASAGVFLEGVSFSYTSEYFKMSKFACGAAEMIYNPITQWYRKGILSSNLIGFARSKQVEWYNKFYILSYVLNYIALSSATIGMVYNLIFCEYIYETVPYATLPINLLYESLFLWCAIGGTLSFLFALRMGFEPWSYFKQLIRELLFMTCLYGSISVKCFTMCFFHLFSINVSFGSTSKDDQRVTLLQWIWLTAIESFVYLGLAACIVVRLLFFTTPDRFNFVLYFGCAPLMWQIFLFWAGPILFDILPGMIPCKGSNKTESPRYDADDKMFSDKYRTNIPNAKLVKNIKVGSSVKLGFNSRATSDASETIYTSRTYDQNTSIKSSVNSHSNSDSMDCPVSSVPSDKIRIATESGVSEDVHIV